MKFRQTTTHNRFKSDNKKNGAAINTMTSMLVIALIVTISACSSGGSDGSSTPSGPTAESPLSGVWEKCLGGLKLTYTFTSTQWEEQQELFQNENCTGETWPDFGAGNFAGSYEVIGNSTSESGLPVMQIKMTSETLDGVGVLEAAKVTRYNIVYTGTPNQLVFGEFSGFEDSIPTKLDFEEPYLLR